MNYNKLFLPLILVLVVGIFYFHNSFALDSNSTDITNVYNQSKPNPLGIPLSSSQLIGIQLSQSCITMLKNNITSNCLTYDKLKFLDNTNSIFSGQWVNSSGYYHRLLTHISNIYTTSSNKFVVMVDPDPLYSIRAKMIIVQSNNFVWINPDDNGTNTRLIQHVNRFVTNPCEGATVAPDIFLVKDTVQYLENGCTHTRFDDTQVIKRTETPWSYDNPFSTLHYLSYLKSIYHTGFTSVNQTGGSGLKDCIHFKCNYKDPYSKW